MSRAVLLGNHHLMPCLILRPSIVERHIKEYDPGTLRPRVKIAYGKDLRVTPK
jgi:hypothetical protein